MSDCELITVEDVPDDEVDLAVFWTGWSTYWGTDQYLDHPNLTPDAAAACAERGYAVGIDTLNLDPTPTQNTAKSESNAFQAHHTLLGADNLIIENLRNLGELSDRFELRAYHWRSKAMALQSVQSASASSRSLRVEIGHHVYSCLTL